MDTRKLSTIESISLLNLGINPRRYAFVNSSCYAHAAVKVGLHKHIDMTFLVVYCHVWRKPSLQPHSSWKLVIMLFDWLDVQKQIMLEYTHPPI